MTPDPESNKNLLNALIRRDQGAFATLHRTYRDRLFVMALYIVENDEEAKDLVQEFFIDFWENRLYEKITASLSSYLLQAIKNRAINYKRNKDTRIRLLSGHTAPAVPGMMHPMENRELGIELDKAIDELPPMAAKVFRLHYIDKLSHAEISKELNISMSTISSHLDRALKSLRASLKRNL
jgi:RNA polymerase sigma-70 factor (ECF subfamily)